MFTPAAVATDDRLRPWLVLVCLDRALVAPPHMTRADGTRGPLPVVELTADAVATELPDLRESWAWAHAQVTRDDAAGPVAGDASLYDPILNLSRLLCPRHLVRGRSYVACLVPAFDARRTTWSDRSAAVPARNRPAVDDRPGLGRRQPHAAWCCRSTTTGSSPRDPQATSRSSPSGWTRSSARRRSGMRRCTSGMPIRPFP